MLRPPLTAILFIRVELRDKNPRNFHLIRDKIFLIDFKNTAPVDLSRVDKLEEAVDGGCRPLVRVLP